MERGMSTKNYYKEERPWGSFERFVANEVSTVKLLHIAPGKRFSLQKHAKRAEFWRVVAGSGKITVGEDTRPFNMNEEALVPQNTLHRLEGGPEGMTVLELISGEYLEEDIERVADDFGRV